VCRGECILTSGTDRETVPTFHKIREWGGFSPYEDDAMISPKGKTLRDRVKL
jgi:hypothetical protein